MMSTTPLGLRSTIRLLAWLLPAIAFPAPPAPIRSDVLIDEEVRVSPSRVRPLEFDLTRSARVFCKFRVVEGLSGVRAVLLKRDDVRLWLTGRAHSFLASTDYAESGGFTFLLQEPGGYAIVLDNRLEGRAAAVVQLQVTLLYGQAAAGPVQTPDPFRSRLLVWGSILLFVVGAAYSGWKLRFTLARRSEPPSNPGWPPLWP